MCTIAPAARTTCSPGKSTYEDVNPFGAVISISRSCGVSAGTTELLATGRAATFVFALPAFALPPREFAEGCAAFDESFDSKMPLECTELIEPMIAERCAGAFAL